MQTALDFLKEHYEVAFATCEDNRPKLRLFQIMRHEGTTLYFATSTQKAVYDKLVYFALRIEVMDYYDLRPTPPILRHFDLRAGTETGGFVGERFMKGDK